MPTLVLALLAFVTFQADPAARGRDVLSAILAKEFPKIEAQFDDKMKAALPPGRLEALWLALQLQAGAYKTCDSAAARVVAIDAKQMVITPCEFERAKINVQFAFDADGKISGLSFRPNAPPPPPYSPPSYASPASYAESEITIGAGGEWPLPGTLTRPVGEGPFPGIVLVHGSGPGDRDATIGVGSPGTELEFAL